MKPDYTTAKKTGNGRKVNGLFKDGIFIRGYVNPGNGYVSQTWFAKNGKHIVWDEPALHLVLPK